MISDGDYEFLPSLSIYLPTYLPIFPLTYLPIFVITQQQQQVPVGPGTLGRILNVIGEPVDEQGPIEGIIYHIMMMLVMR
jgi:flagellar biosynthesis/type III secretory pathway ATPase